jgi:hypothetical protein
MRSVPSREASVPTRRGCPPGPGRRGVCAAFVLLIVPLAGCTLGASKQAVVPPPPKPEAVQQPPPEPQLSTPQTVVTLPELQPVNPGAIPKVQTVEAAPPLEKTEAPPTTRTPHRAAVTTKTTDQGSDAEPPPTPPAPEQAPFQPILNADELKRIKGDIDGRKKEINEKLSRAKGHSLSEHDQSLVDHINSFLAQCQLAEARGDYSQADALSERALILAKELQGGE